MRITDSMRLSSALLDESRASQKVYDLTQESASGNLINAPSDDPGGYATLVSMDARLTIMQGRSTAATTASGNLDTAGSALSSAGDLLDQAKQIATETASGTDDATARANAASSVTSLVQQRISLGNTQGADGSYLFGGTKTGTPPFDAAGNFSGNNGVTQVSVADNVLSNSNVSGADAFTSAGGGSNVIADLQALATALTSNNVTAISSSIGQMETDRQQVTAVMVQAGAASSSLQASTQVITSLTTATETARANLDSAATAAVYSELQSTETAYQTSLSVTQQILSLNAFAGSQA
jgi:flagellar hook-associated protein 3 FlgL